MFGGFVSDRDVVQHNTMKNNKHSVLMLIR